MITRRALPAMVAAGAALSAPAAKARPPGGGRFRRPARRRAEAEALRAFAEKTHPRGRSAAADPQWRGDWAALEAQADSLSEAAYVMALKARLAWFQDGHTTVYISAITAPGFDLRLPILVRPCYDGLLVLGAGAESELLGAKITHVDGAPIEEVMRRFAKGWPATNPAWVHHDASLALLPAILRATPLISPGAFDLPVRIDGEADGRRVSARLVPSPRAQEGIARLSQPKTTIETWRPSGAVNFVHREANVLFVAFDSLSEGLDPTIKFVREVITRTEEPGLDRIVLDLRRNGGGDNFLGEGLRKHFERSQFNRPGGLYVLIGPQSFSAAQNLITRLERETYAIFVGEPSGGAPNHYGDSALFEGAHFKAGVSTVPWFDSYPADRRNWTMPDILIPALMADGRAGRDPVLEAAFHHRAEATINDLSRDRTVVYARASQSQVWKPFWLA